MQRYVVCSYCAAVMTTHFLFLADYIFIIECKIVFTGHTTLHFGHGLPLNVAHQSRQEIHGYFNMFNMCICVYVMLHVYQAHLKL